MHSRSRPRATTIHRRSARSTSGVRPTSTSPTGSPATESMPTRAGREEAEVRVIEGRTYVSPRRLRLRVLEAIVDPAGGDPMELWDLIVPKKEARRARRQLARQRRRDPHARSFVHQSPWHVPI